MKTTFGRLLLSQTVSRFSNAALCFVLLVCLLQQTGSAALYGSVTALATVPMLLGVLFGGALADRCRRQRLLSGLDIAAAFGMLMAAAFVNSVPILPFVLLLLCILYAAEGLAQPTAQACIPLLLHGAELQKGNAIFQFCTALAEILGTLLGNALFSALGLRSLLLFCAILFVIASAGEFGLELPYRPVRNPVSSKQIVPMHRTLWLLAALLALLNLAVIPAFTVGMPVLVLQALAQPDDALALTQAAMRAGSLLGCIVVAAQSKRITPCRGAASLWCITALCVLLGLSALPLLPSDFAYAFITLSALCMMAAASAFQIQLNAILQFFAPREQMGHVMSTFTVAACLTQPAGQALFGFAYEKAAAFPVIVPLGAAAASFFIAAAASCILDKVKGFTDS